MSEYTQNKMPKDANLCRLIRKTITLNRKELGLEFEDVAHELGMHPGTLQNKLKPSYDLGDLTLTEFVHFLELTGDLEALQYIASKFDMVCVSKVVSHASIADINLLADRANIENADVFRVVKEAMANGSISKDEQTVVLKEIDEAERANAALKDMILHVAIKG